MNTTSWFWQITILGLYSIIFCLSPIAVWAEVPGLINYQGKIFQNGKPITTDPESPLPVIFRLYNSPEEGTLLYEESQNVEVSNGIYSIRLGLYPTANGEYSNLFDVVAMAEDIWLEVEINGEILKPRQQITSSAYALRAGDAEVAATVINNSITSDSIINSSITEAKLADGAVTLAKLSNSMCSQGEMLVKTETGWTCGTPALPLCQDGDFINCYSGPPQTIGVASCRAGIRYCNAGHTGYGPCTGQVLPEAEICDGIDNDCNGKVDDNVTGTPVWYQDADNDGYGNPAGMIRFCPGQEQPGYVQNADDCDDSSFAVNPGFGERCDGKDSNCDGEVDNNCVNTACTEDEINQVVNGEFGVSSGCLKAGMALVNCMQTNHCGELLSPDLDCMRAHCASEWETAMGSIPPECHSGDTRPCGTDEGECRTGIETCSTGNTWSGICDGEIPPEPEICDGLDNNCDGVVDNPETPQWCLDADGDRYVDGCVEECEQPGDEWIPYTTILAEGDCDDRDPEINYGAQELCDGIDNDCDGTIDENFPNLATVCDTGMQGACKEGIFVCSSAGDTVVCQQTVWPEPEICDGIDNDCDGDVDEDLNGSGEACDTGLQGICGPGTMTCIGGVMICQQNLAPQPEDCDGIDNDCDGTVDEGLNGAGPLTTNQQGVCQGARQSCFSGNWTDYYDIIPSYGLEIIDNWNCDDGLDNDCDGMIDSNDTGCN